MIVIVKVYTARLPTKLQIEPADRSFALSAFECNMVSECGFAFPRL
jgi:hypothetical protein